MAQYIQAIATYAPRIDLLGAADSTLFIVSPTIIIYGLDLKYETSGPQRL